MRENNKLLLLRFHRRLFDFQLMRLHRHRRSTIFHLFDALQGLCNVPVVGYLHVPKRVFENKKSIYHNSVKFVDWIFRCRKSLERSKIKFVNWKFYDCVKLLKIVFLRIESCKMENKNIRINNNVHFLNCPCLLFTK